MFNKFYSSESGNIFFALFGAVIIVGLLGTVVVSTMRGPLSTMVNVQTRTKAESEMDIASRLVLLEATQLANDGDCDSDGFVEPLEYKDASGSGPTGGGFLPNIIASSRIDPWGIEYGYCAWDAGGTTNAIACDTDSSGTNDRLDGNSDPSDETYTVIAVISAGQDQVFQTICNGGSSPSITKGGDDIVVEFTYGTAIAATNGLWNIKSGDPSTAEIDKNLEVTGGASFTAGIDLTSSTAALQLGAASMLFPNETTLTTCNGANEGLIRIDTSSDPDVLQICDATNGWVPVSNGFWNAGSGNDIYYNSGTPQVGIGTTTPAEALDVAGNIALTGNLVANGNLSGVDLSATGNTIIGGTLGVTGATTLTTLNSTAAVDFDTTLNVDGSTTLGGTLNVTGSSVFVGTIDAQGIISSSTGDLNIGDNLIVTGTSDLQGAVSSSTGNLTLNDAVDITGAIDAQNSISSSTGNLALSDNVDITGDASISGDITGTNITASATLNAGTTINVNGDQLGPAINCAAAQKLVWTNGSGWSCDTDLQGGSGGGSPNLQDVLTTGNDAATLSAVNLGGVGIGTASPSAELHIDEGNLLVTGTYTGTSAVPVSGAGTRMFFQPATGAFRAGTVTGTEWDDANIGTNSIAMGYDTTASNTASVAIGSSVTASGWRSAAFGFNSIVSGSYAMAFGREVMASGDYGVGFGLGDASVTRPTISGTSSFGIFMGDQSGVDLTTANTMGLFGGKMVIDPNIPATNLVADTALEIEGTLKIADGGEACAAGIAGAIRYNGGALSYCNGTSWTTIAATGGTASLSGLTAATATNTIANANFAQVWNWDTLTTETAIGIGSTSITSGELLDVFSSSTGLTGTIGNFTLTGNNAANTGTVLKASVTGTSSAAVPIMATNAGTGASLRINDDGTDTDTTPFLIDNAGNVGIGTSSPQASLDIAGTGAIITPRGTEAQRPATPADGMIRYKTDTGTSTIGFEVRESGAWVAMGAAVSDKRLKENIKPLSGKEILERLAKINTYSYTMKNDKTKRINYGVIAQELQKEFPELVNGSPDDPNNMMSVNYLEFIAPMIEAVKELRAENHILKNNITALKTAQNEANATLEKIDQQIILLNRTAGNTVGKASMQPLLLLLLGIISGMGIIVIIQHRKEK